MWNVVASPAASLIAAVIVIILLVRTGYHRDDAGKLIRKRLASVLILGAATYTFAVLSLSQLLGGPALSKLSSEGFGDGRVAWLLLGVVADGIFRIWDEFRKSDNNGKA